MPTISTPRYNSTPCKLKHRNRRVDIIAKDIIAEFRYSLRKSLRVPLGRPEVLSQGESSSELM